MTILVCGLECIVDESMRGIFDIVQKWIQLSALLSLDDRKKGSVKDKSKKYDMTWIYRFFLFFFGSFSMSSKDDTTA